MKKNLILCSAVLMLAASCTTITKTSTTANVPQSLLSATVADLNVAKERVTSHLEPSKAIRRGGLSNIKRAAEAQALAEYAKKTGVTADLLLEPQYVIEKRRGFWGTKVKSVTVSGRPASYTGFHSLNDSVWTNRTFRNGYGDCAKRSNVFFKGLFGK